MHHNVCLPIVQLPDRDVEQAFRAAIHNVTVRNTVDCPFAIYNRTGLLDAQEPFMLRAGGVYQQPWTRDAAVNTWTSANLLEPGVARNTLWAVCENDPDGRPVIQQDDQYWDKIIWAVGAWNHYLVTGDRDFLQTAWGVVRRALTALRQEQFNETFGLFRGGSFFNDGIAGYPKDLLGEGPYLSTSVWDYPRCRDIMCLSTNCLYCEAYRIAGRMAALCGEAPAPWTRLGTALNQRINALLWNVEKGRYSYFLYPDGRVFDAQEACGNLFAVLFGLCGQDRAQTVLDHLQRCEYGLPSIYEPLEGQFSRERPGRHNNLLWPFINGFYMMATSRLDREDLLGRELRSVTGLVKASHFEFYEIYNPYDGSVCGGWQADRLWGSCEHQTWSASGYLGAVLFGVFGLRTEEDAIGFQPCVPAYLAGASIENLTVGQTKLTIRLKGHGSVVTGAWVNDQPCRAPRLPKQAGTFEVLLELEPKQ